MPAPLTVYRASAGAGKTFRLVVEYIKLLMLRPDEYKSILAVTFTKKATQEMKIRILSQLYGLREGLSSSAGYMERITKEMNLKESDVRKNAAVALGMILNDYGHFRIETIDSFFQRVLRNMTRELDIVSNMHVELNGEQVKNKAVDELIDNLEPTDYIFMRIKDFAEENMREGKTWNVINSLKDFGKNIFSDFYQSHSKEYKVLFEESESNNIFKEYKLMLKNLIETSTESIVSAAEKLRSVIEAQGFDISQFSRSYASGLGLMYEYIANGDVIKVPATVRKYAEDENNWLTAPDRKKYGTQKIADYLLPALCNYLVLHDKLAIIINTCKEIKINLNNLELLGTIEEVVDASNKKANRFLLSSTNQLLADMIGTSDSPFIFEKIGTQIRHLMIDEFQDTSTLQWHNFKNLLQETMSYYNPEKANGTVGSMIVGDVKQSIYRWRDGDWKLLDNIQHEFRNQSDTKIENLDTNFRSEANIINFNNAFFDQAMNICNVQNAYSDVHQNVSPKITEEKGEVEFYMLSEKAYKQRHDMICKKVAELLSRGVEAKDIAILGRKNRILKELAKEFMDNYPGIKVVSMESFILGSSTAVCAIICALRLLLNPEDKILLATIEKYSGKSAEECKNIIENIDAKKPLLDIVEDIFRSFNIVSFKGDSAFVTAFFDYLKDFASKNTSTIRNFLKYWDETISGKAIETESTDGIQMMTIHKSKGLEFDCVIVADGGWDYELLRNHFWVEIKDEPFSKVPFNILQPKKTLEDTIFDKDYRNEVINNTIDHLNLLYVAFTRAGKNLYFYGQTNRKIDDVALFSIADKVEGDKKSKSKDKSTYSTKNISGLVENCLDNFVEGVFTHEEIDFYTEEEKADENIKSDELYGYTKRFGRFAIKEQDTDKKDEDEDKQKNVFEMPVEPVCLSLHESQPEVKFVQSNRSKDFINSSVEESDEFANELASSTKTSEGNAVASNSFVSTGILLHYVLSQIETIDDVDRVLQKLEFEGVITNKSHSALIRKRINGNKQTKNWFSKEWTVYNECSILTSKGPIRPDRVITNGEETIVIDFKFGKPDTEYENKITLYKQKLQEIGLPNVKAFLWYVYTDKVEEI